MKSTIYILGLLLCIVPLGVMAVTPLTIKEIEIPSLRMAIDDLDHTLNPVRELLAKANAGVDKTHIHEEITLAHDGDSVRFESWNLLVEEPSIPKYITSVHYRYAAERDAPIVTLTIYLRPSLRQISIEGKDKSQIESISALLEKELSIHSNFLSSNSFKVAGAIVLMIVGVLLVYLRKGENEMVWPLNLFGMLLVMSPIVLPWDRWLSGVAIFTGSSSYIDIYINYISVFGVLVSVVSLFIPMMKSNKAIQPTPKNGA